MILAALIFGGVGTTLMVYGGIGTSPLFVGGSIFNLGSLISCILVLVIVCRRQHMRPRRATLKTHPREFQPTALACELVNLVGEGNKIEEIKEKIRFLPPKNPDGSPTSEPSFEEVLHVLVTQWIDAGPSLDLKTPRSATVLKCFFEERPEDVKAFLENYPRKEDSKFRELANKFFETNTST